MRGEGQDLPVEDYVEKPYFLHVAVFVVGSSSYGMLRSKTMRNNDKEIRSC